MENQMFDADLAAVRNPTTTPAQLADIAARRGDLHPLILQHPGCYPQLRDWLSQVNSATAQSPLASQHPIVAQYPASQYPIGAPAAPAAPARRGVGCLLIGCGGLAVLAFLVVVLIVIGALATSPSGSSPSPDPVGGESNREQSTDAFEIERTRFYALAAQLDGNPVAPLVADAAAFERIGSRFEDAAVIDSYLAEGVVEAQEMNAQLEQRIADAATRSANASGSVTEALVDEAGRGYIDIFWDAATACGTSSREGRTTIGCTSEDPLAVHIAPEAQLGGDMGMRQVVLHELSHLYMRADSDTSEGLSRSSQLVEQGYFQGSSEVFADCYALTYLDLWTLTFEGRDTGYGYVCGDEERRLMREWAAEVHAPMPQ